MSAAFLEKISLLPPEKQAELEDFAQFLLSKYATGESEQKEDIGAIRLANMGRMKGQIWMAPDFNETPEDFKDYL